ncbi:MAG: hypothetical protein AAGC60_29625 [Acidobacteriota bacterium]
MSRRAGKIDAETLSAYLDGELAADEVRGVEAALEREPSARRQLDGLRRVSTHMRRVQRVAPPSTLQQDVARRIVLEGRHTSLLDRVESGLHRVGGESPMLAMFALVISLAVIVLVFAQAVDRTREALLPVRFEDSLADETDAVDLRRARQVIVAGRLFERRGDLWVEDGIFVPADRVVQLASPTGQILLERHPELRGVAYLERARLEIDGEVLDLLGTPPPAAPPSADAADG